MEKLNGSDNIPESHDASAVKFKPDSHMFGGFCHHTSLQSDPLLAVFQSTFMSVTLSTGGVTCR